LQSSLKSLFAGKWAGIEVLHGVVIRHSGVVISNNLKLAILSTYYKDLSHYASSRCGVFPHYPTFPAAPLLTNIVCYI
jgi:hypothetical protein